MDFYITKEEVVKSINLTLGVVEKRQTLPILSNVLFEVDESSLKLTATDLERAKYRQRQQYQISRVVEKSQLRQEN